MSQFLRKPWILQDFLELKSLETKIEQTKSVQIIQFLSYRDADKPDQIITAELSDKSTYIKASFSSSCTQHFERERSLTSMKGALIQLKEYYFRLHREFGRVACHIHVEKFNYVGSDGCMTFGEPHYLCRNVYVKGRLQKLAQCDQSNVDVHKELSDLSSSPSEILENIFSQQGETNENLANDTYEETEMMQTDSLLGVSVGWKDLRKITERDCIIPPNQQELLDNLSDWKIEEDIRENLEDLDSFNWCTQIRTTQNEPLAATQSGSPKSTSSIESFSIPVEYGEEIYESQSDIELSEVTSFPSAESENARTGENQTTASNLFGDNFCSQPIELRLIPLNKLIETKKLDFTNEDEDDPLRQQAVGRPNDRLYEVSYESSPAELAADFARYLIKNDHDQLNQHLSYIRRDSTMKMMDSFGATLRRVCPESPNISTNIVDVETVAQKEPEFDPNEAEMTSNEKLVSIASDNFSKSNHKGKERNLLAITRIGEGIKWNLPGFENPTSLKELEKNGSTSIDNAYHGDSISPTSNILKEVADSVTSSVERLRKTCDDYGSGLIKDTQDMAPITQIMPIKFNLIEFAEDIEEAHFTEISGGELSSQESYVDSSILAKSCSSECHEKTLFPEDFKASEMNKEIEELSVTPKPSVQNGNTIYIEVDDSTSDKTTPTMQNGEVPTSGYYRELRKVFSISWLAKKRKRDPLAEDSNEW